MHKRWSFALRWVFAGCALAALFYKVPLTNVLAAVTSADIRLLFAALLAILCTQLISAKRLKLLTDANDLGLTTYELFRINLATMFYGLFLPAGNVAGFAIRIYRVSQPNKQYVGSIVSILFDRVVATWALCLVGIVAWLVDASRETWPVLLLMVAALIGITLLQAMFFIDWRTAVPRGFSRMLMRIVPSKFQPSPDTIDQFRSIPRRTFVQVMALSVVAHLVGIVAYQLISVALELPVSWRTIVWIRSASMLASMLPVSVAGLGVRDVTLLTLLVPLGVSGGQAVAYSMLIFAVTVLAIGMVGGVLEALPTARKGDVSV